MYILIGLLADKQTEILRSAEEATIDAMACDLCSKAFFYKVPATLLNIHW